MTEAEDGERAALLLRAGRAAAALELVAPLLLSGDDPAPHVIAVRALLTLDRAAEAAQLADAALGAFGPVPALFRAAADAHLAAGDSARALLVARHGVEHHPQWVPGLLVLAEAARFAGDLHTADDVVAQAAALAPEDPAVWLVAANLEWTRKRLPLARRHLRTVLRLDPVNTAAMRGLGLLDERRSRYGGAARWYAAALRLHPEDRDLTIRLRTLFGRFLAVVTLALAAIGFVAFAAFLTWADPTPGTEGGPPVQPVWAAAHIAAFLGVTWYSLRGAPRVVLQALAAETRAYRRVRRCARLAVAQAVVVALTIVAALVAAGVPVGEPRDRLPAVLLVWLVSMLLMIWQCVALRVAFGYGQRHPAREHPRDRLTSP